MRVAHVLFDLDGTLTDPVEGITRCLRYALETLGATSPPLSQLAAYIGPPLRVTFAELLNADRNASAVEQAVQLYRERFSTVGLFENDPYPGVVEMLRTLRAIGFRLYIATSKPHVFAQRILRHFALDGYFAAVYGSELDGRHDDKGELVQFLLQQERLSGSETVMVGDRSHDVLAARQNSVLAMGVTYGYGTEGELLQAKADFLCHSPADVMKCLQQLGEGVGESLYFTPSRMR
jgi:phosphoglycolate phosphatase